MIAVGVPEQASRESVTRGCVWLTVQAVQAVECLLLLVLNVGTASVPFTGCQRLWLIAGLGWAPPCQFPRLIASAPSRRQRCSKTSAYIILVSLDGEEACEV